MDRTVRALTAADAEAFRELRLLGLREAPQAFASSAEEEEGWPLERFVAWIEGANDARAFGAFAAGRLVGVAGFSRDRHLKMRHRGGVYGVFVRSEARGGGHGKALMEALIDYARGLEGLWQLHLDVGTTNRAALRLYESLGFERTGTHPRMLIVDGVPLDEAMLVLPLRPFLVP